jgi:hypothetical protein
MRRKPTENFASLPKYLVIETQTGQSKSMWGMIVTSSVGQSWRLGGAAEAGAAAEANSESRSKCSNGGRRGKMWIIAGVLRAIYKVQNLFSITTKPISNYHNDLCYGY